MVDPAEEEFADALARAVEKFGATVSDPDAFGLVRVECGRAVVRLFEPSPEQVQMGLFEVLERRISAPGGRRPRRAG